MEWGGSQKNFMWINMVYLQSICETSEEGQFDMICSSSFLLDYIDSIF